MRRLLAIAGSDCSAGAGLQADLKTAQALGVYAQTAVTAVTVQNTLGVGAVHVLAPRLVREQIEACLSDIGADAIKIGMLGSSAIAAAVADALQDCRLPIVLDPVLVSSSGAVLLDDAGIAILQRRLFAQARLVTPNLPEAERLFGFVPETADGHGPLMAAMQRQGIKALLLKGGHGTDENSVTDVLLSDEGTEVRVMARQAAHHTHGTGCTLSTAIACGLAKGLTLRQAVAGAQEFVQRAIGKAPGLGAGRGPLEHAAGVSAPEKDLAP